MSQPSDLLPCPISCPNRRRDGLRLFGATIDPAEMGLHVAVWLLILIPAVRQSVREDFSWQEAMGWFGGAVGASTVLRMAPTDRINAYQKLFGK